jgi:hypothetical protein
VFDAEGEFCRLEQKGKSVFEYEAEFKKLYLFALQYLCGAQRLESGSTG